MDPARQHAHDAARFTELVDLAESSDAWDRPCPVEGWSARDVVEHLIDWLPGLLERGGVELEPVDTDELALAWRSRTDAVQRVLDDRGETPIESPMNGTTTVARMIDQFYTGDIWLHTWDLATALGVPPELGEQRCVEVLTAMEPLDATLRDSGHFGPKVDVPATAPAEDRLMGFLGRDPAWRA